jgi:hypothetical protein
MFSIGELSRRTKVKVPTIRYYEDMGLLAEAERTAGNQTIRQGRIGATEFHPPRPRSGLFHRSDPVVD